jgi:predicted DCC family thiol-disulfide oxidoreductase YuxK
MEASGPILLFDGTCGLCDRSVKWILAHEADHALQFAPLQGETAAALRTRYPAIPATLSTMVLIEDGVVRLRSKGILYSAKHLRSPWRWLYGLRWIPAILMDLGYRFIAAIRYRVWGHVDPACQLPSAETRARFLP